MLSYGHIPLLAKPLAALLTAAIFWCTATCNYYYCNRFTALWILSGTTWVIHYQKGKTKTNLDFWYACVNSSHGVIHFAKISCLL